MFEVSLSWLPFLVNNGSVIWDNTDGQRSRP